MFFNLSFSDNPDPKYIKSILKDKKFIDDLKTIFLSEVFLFIVKGSEEFYKNPVFIKPKQFKLKTDKILVPILLLY